MTRDEELEAALREAELEEEREELMMQVIIPPDVGLAFRFVEMTHKFSGLMDEHYRGGGKPNSDFAREWKLHPSVEGCLRLSNYFVGQTQGISEKQMIDHEEKHDDDK